jgi:putative ABC transport system permease protein
VRQMKAPRDRKGSWWLVELARDFRHAARLLKQNPAFTAVGIATVALCIGANSAVFGAVYAILLRPLPFDHPEQLYVLDASYRGAGREFTSIADAADWRALNHVFTHLVARRTVPVLRE